MKKILMIFFITLFAFGLIAPKAMAVTPKGEEMVIGVFVGSESVPPVPLTAKDVEKIAVKERQETVKSVKRIFDAKDTKTAAALKVNNWAIDNLVGVNRGATVALNNLDKRVVGMSSQLDKKVIGEASNTKWLLVGVMVLGFIVLALLILWNGSSTHAVRTTLDRVEKRVYETSAVTAQLVKQLESITIVVNVAGYKVTFRPEIIDNMYRSLYVPISAEDTNASEIARARKVDPGAIHNSTRDVMKLYFSGKCSSLQKKVIEHLEGTPALNIEKITV